MDTTQMNLNMSIESRQDAKPAKENPYPPIAPGAIAFSWRAWRE
jgi:hypothetical protein